ncbi:4-alpha-glucanotransferase [Chitinophaga rhizophila]|uniref:4-alpha-glucanotransferase n=1 Tax=Chitinophaga rhizophila TaxID=2866212 RepID=A0ABS7GEV2_9BACT|nr:4-alpha-glucanotransferase [Chitinophaga rhizophila]MBW8685685.1 4-alpha-glucanotransferase [Chitinophaga rhizophila]
MRKERSAGVLLHITSLPGPFGIGDIGPEAYKFAEQLAASGQRYWQLLPVNPVSGSDHSPYSALSSMAGNIQFISPELLVTEGLLTEQQINEYITDASEKVDYQHAENAKSALLEMAYASFQKQPDHPYQKAFRQYTEEAGYWLNDYATYRVLCAHYDNKPWPEWDKGHCYKNCTLNPTQQQAMLKEKWWQFLFDEQWKALKAHCNQLGVQLFGDLPIYISSTAADIWAHPDLFEVDEQGQMKEVAGVPPDYFNEKGQLWNMPIYNWQLLKERNYDWWIQRIKRNLEWFDVIRLDHFRAFSAYWKVPANAPDAIEGEWVSGPANDLFDALQSAFPDLPFVAEDLGLIDDDVRKLRDDYDIPCMRVLQFAFGDDMPTSEHILHQLERNTVLLTGTHDNNTTRGWFKEEADKKTRKNVRAYTGQEVTARTAPRILSQLAYASVANTVILPMQDILALPGSARMNIPATPSNNWTWRMEKGAFSEKIIKRLKKWVKCYGRSVEEEKEEVVGDAE